MRIFVVGVPDFLRAHEQLNLIDLLFVKVTLLFELADLLHSLLLVAGDFKFVFVTPKDSWLCLYSCLRQKGMQVNNLVETSIANNHNHSTMVHLDTVFNEYADSIVNFLLHF